MRSIIIGAGVVFAVLFATPQISFSAVNHTAFCARWKNVCVNGRQGCNTFPNPLACRATCEDRRVACLSSGCYHFNKTGDVCDPKK